MAGFVVDLFALAVEAHGQALAELVCDDAVLAAATITAADGGMLVLARCLDDRNRQAATWTAVGRLAHLWHPGVAVAGPEHHLRIELDERVAYTTAGPVMVAVAEGAGRDTWAPATEVLGEGTPEPVVDPGARTVGPEPCIG